jgi:hypothetical protein
MFEWLTFNPAPIVGHSRPQSIHALRDKPQVWRALFRDWLKANHPDHVDGLAFAMAPEKVLDNPQDRETHESWVRYYDRLLHKGGDFYEEIGRLKDALEDDPNGVGRQLAASATGPRLAEHAESIIGAYATIEQAKHDLVEQVHKVVDNFGRCTSWKDHDKAIDAVMKPMREGGEVDGVPALAFRSAEAALREAIDKCKADTAEDGDWVTLAGALEDFIRAGVSVAAGLGQGAQLCWNAAVDHTYQQIKENFSSYKPEVANGILGAKTGVFIVGGIITALAPVPVVGQVLAAVGIGLSVTMLLVEKFTIETIAEKEAVKLDVVMEHLGKRYTGSEVNKVLDTGVFLSDKAQLIVDSSAYLGNVLVEQGVSPAKGVVDVLSKGEGAVAMFTGPHIAQASLMIDFYNADPKELRQYVSDEELAVLRQAVQWAYAHKDQMGYDYSRVILHGVLDGRAIMTIGNVRGQLALDTGRFSPDDPKYSFAVAYAQAKREQALLEEDGNHWPRIGWPDEPEFLGFTDDYRFITKATVGHPDGFYETRVEISADGHVTVPGAPPVLHDQGSFDPRNPWGLTDEQLTEKYGPDHEGVDDDAVMETDPALWEEIKQERASRRLEDEQRSYF